MGAATLGGNNFWAIPVRSWVAMPATKKFIHNPRESSRPIGRLERWRKRLAECHYRLVPYMYKRHFATTTRERGDLIWRYMEEGLLFAAASYKPKYRKNGKRIRFTTWACRTIYQYGLAAVTEWRESWAFAHVAQRDDGRAAQSFDFVPDPATVEEKWPYEGFTDEQWRSIAAGEEDKSRWHDIAYRRFGKGETLQSIADDYGITRERARQIAGRYLTLANSKLKLIQQGAL